MTFTSEFVEQNERETKAGNIEREKKMGCFYGSPEVPTCFILVNQFRSNTTQKIWNLCNCFFKYYYIFLSKDSKVKGNLNNLFLQRAEYFGLYLYLIQELSI